MQRTALVTGANRGIGKEIARQLAAAGLKVYVTARDLKKAKAVADTIGPNAIAMKLDVNNPKSISAANTRLNKEIKQLDVLVNNAGIFSKSAAKELNAQQLDAVMLTNFTGPVKLTSTLLPLLQKSGDARVVNISSGMGARADLTQGYAPYRLSKWALNGWTMLLGNELRGTSVAVYAMCPGWVRTDMGGKEAYRSVEQGADTALWLSTETPAPPTASSFRDRKVIPW